MSPRLGLDHWARCHLVNGTLKSYAILSTKTRSPTRMVGCMEPDGTWFQSASDERTENIIKAKTRIGRISFRHQRRARARKRMPVIFMRIRPAIPELVQGN